MELRTNETISVTDIQCRAKEVFGKIESGEQEKYVVMKNNAIAAVLTPADRYEALMDELEDLRIDAVARERLVNSMPVGCRTRCDITVAYGNDPLAIWHGTRSIGPAFRSGAVVDTL